MEKREFQRVSANLDARFFYDDMYYSGRILNLSEKGMFISTMKYVPSDSKFLIFVRLNNDILELKAKVKRVTRKNSDDDGIGIELIEPGKVYLKHLLKIKEAE